MDIKEIKEELKNEIEEQLNKNTKAIKELKKCINNSIKDTKKTYAKAKRELGIVLKTHNVPFPQELNFQFAEVTTKFDNITDCLVSLP